MLLSTAFFMKLEHSNYSVQVSDHKDLVLEEWFYYILCYFLFFTKLYPLHCVNMKIRPIWRAENRPKVSENKLLIRT
jgi:hypothetical protein